MNTITLGINIINALTPFAISGLLLINYLQKKRDYYLFWTTSFAFYGLANLINVYMRVIGTENPGTVTILGVVTFLAFTSMVMGVGRITNNVVLYLRLSLTIPVITLGLYLAGIRVFAFTIFFLLPYIIMTVLMLIIGLNYAINLRIMLIGWILILASNVGIALGALTVTTSPMIALTGKIFIFYWMTRPYFTDFAEDFEKNLVPRRPESIIHTDPVITMVEVKTGSIVLEWIKEQAITNATAGVITIIFLVSEEDMDTGGMENLSNTYVFKLMEGFHVKKAIFSEPLIEISNDMNELSILVYDIKEYSAIHDLQVKLIFYDGSYLIKRNGWRRVYSQMISMIPQLKDANLKLTFIFSEELLENKHVKETIKILADKIITLKD